MKALIYGTITVITLVIGMQVASSIANNASESINESTSTKYESLEKQLSGN